MLLPATQQDHSYSIPSYVDTQAMCWARFFGVERNMNYPLGRAGSVSPDLTPFHDNAANANTFWSPRMSEPCMMIENHDTAGALELTPPSIVQRLASLDVELFECGLKLPFPIKAGSGSTGIGTRKSKLFALDELFRLTTEFLDILKALSQPSSMTQTELDAQTTLSSITDSQRLSDIVQPAGIGNPASCLAQADEPTAFMIMSCHGRLTEIYGSLFQMMHACIEHSLAPRGGKDWAVILPQLQVGSIASPPVHVDINNPVSPSTSSMYMLMIAMLSSQLWEQLADTLRADDGSPVGRGSASALTDTIWNAMMDRNENMSRTIESTRHLLQRYSVVAG
jgi:hypothetical protein